MQQHCSMTTLISILVCLQECGRLTIEVLFKLATVSHSQQEFNIFVADLSREVTSQQLLVRTHILTQFRSSCISLLTYRNSFRNITDL